MKAKHRWLYASLVIAGLMTGASLLVFLFLPQWPTYQGRMMEQWLAILSKDSSGPKTLFEARLYQWKLILAQNSFPPAKALQLTQVMTGQEPECFTFEVPLSYDLMTNYGFLTITNGILRLAVDVVSTSGYYDHARATNGNCLLFWTPYDHSPGHRLFQDDIAPGPHRINAELQIFGRGTGRQLQASGAPIIITLPSKSSAKK
jgi:hypothetical protein